MGQAQRKNQPPFQPPLHEVKIEQEPRHPKKFQLNTGNIPEKVWQEYHDMAMMRGKHISYYVGMAVVEYLPVIKEKEGFNRCPHCSKSIEIDYVCCPYCTQKLRLQKYEQ